MTSKVMRFAANTTLRAIGYTIVVLATSWPVVVALVLLEWAHNIEKHHNEADHV